MIRNVMSWYIRNIIMPKIWSIDNPGFVITKFGMFGKETFGREIMISEDMLAELENNIENKEVLYYTGKNFGNFFAEISNFPNIKKYSIKEVEKFGKGILLFVGGVWAKNIKTLHIDLEKKILELELFDFVVCRKNRRSFLFSEGGISGIWSYMTGDDSVEGSQLSIKNSKVSVVFAPRNILKERGISFLTAKKISFKKESRRYKELNFVRKAKYSRNSLRSLIDSGFIKYENRMIIYKKDRFFPVEINFMYILEKELKGLKSGSKILWDVCFDFGRRLAEISGNKDPAKFIMDFFPALGFGDIYVKRDPWKVMINLFPWTEMEKDIDFIMIRGMLSGVISGMSGKEVRLKKLKKSISGQGFSLIME